MIEKTTFEKCRHNVAAEFKPAYIQGEDFETARVVFVSPEGREITMRATPPAWARIRGNRLGGRVDDQRHSGYDRIANHDFVVCAQTRQIGGVSEDVVIGVHRIKRQAYDRHSEPQEIRDLKDIVVTVDSVSGEMIVDTYPMRTRKPALHAMLYWLEKEKTLKPGDAHSNGTSTFRVKSAGGDELRITHISVETSAPTTTSAAIAEKEQELAGAARQD